MKTASAKPCFFDRYSKFSPALVEQKKPIGPEPADGRFYFYGVPPGLTEMQKLVLRGMDRIGQPMIRAEMVRRFNISADSLNLALVALEQHGLVERLIGKGYVRYALKPPPADCVFARNAGDADALECLSDHEPKARIDRANQAIVFDAIRRAEAISGIPELRPFLPSDHPQLSDHAARKAIKQLVDAGTIVEQSIRLTPRRCAVVYALADTSNGSNHAGDATRRTQAIVTGKRA